MKLLVTFLLLLNPISLARSLISNLKVLYTNKSLVFEMTKRELMDRYVGQVFGQAWIILHPIIVMGVFVFLFSVVYRAKVGGSIDMPMDFTTYILAGLVPWLSFQEVLSKSCSTIRSHQSFVKQIIFPIEILPTKEVLVSYVTMGISLVVLFTYVLITTRTLPLSYLFLPVIMVLHFFLASGISYFLSSVSVYFRDLKDFIQVFTFVGMYMLPIVFLPQWVPKQLYPIIKYNPFSHLIWCYHDVLYYGSLKHPISWVVTTIFAFVSYGIGIKTFNHLKSYFGSAL